MQATTIAPNSPIDQPIQTNERIRVLDVLRGIAILGMIISHFDGYEERLPRNQMSQIVGDWVHYFIDDRFYTLFAILFGAGFAIQLIRANNRNENFIPRFLRRMFGLACFGFIVEVGFGFEVLYSYALCGLLLLLVRNWSTKTLLITAIICVMFNPLFKIAKNTTRTLRYGAEIAKQKSKQLSNAQRQFAIQSWQRDSIEKNTKNYLEALKARTELFIYNHQPNNELYFIHFLSDNFMLFLLGFIGIRKRIFQEPGKHRKLIVWLMIFGTILWAMTFWVVPFFPMTAKLKNPSVPFPLEVTLYFLSTGFGWVRDNWLSFVYAGIVLLLISYNPTKWFKRFKIFSLTGRMALTNYFLQAMILNMLFAKYALAFARIPEYMVPIYSVPLFGTLVLLSSWWLKHFQYGPLEWLWRSLTYWKFQSLRLKPTEKNV